jgi:hypothetical protein
MCKSNQGTVQYISKFQWTSRRGPHSPIQHLGKTSLIFGGYCNLDETVKSKHRQIHPQIWISKLKTIVFRTCSFSCNCRMFCLFYAQCVRYRSSTSISRSRLYFKVWELDRARVRQSEVWELDRVRVRQSVRAPVHACVHVRVCVHARGVDMGSVWGAYGVWGRMGWFWRPGSVFLMVDLYL